MITLKGVVSYPIPLYANVPIHAEYYQPSRFVISAITLGYTTIITTSVAHNYVIGQQVRLIIPNNFGSYQLNEKQGYVLSIPSTTQVEISINSNANVDAFILATNLINVAQILAIGDVNMGATNTNGLTNNITFISGSFIDISPN